ncbi:MAG: molybdopterin molybdotransferase MoeA [Myxococcota bacterium]|nr:molybdopterin molybdotransferase MoeA [Deltaproteobacteria bacterium]MDQ3335569.1 molybdopterin molybdotransferase MoeA [Myxococcota bacterium]
MRSVVETTRAVIARMPRLASEEVELAAAVGRVLAKDVTATRQLPGFDNSAMDGYAARSAALPGTFAVTQVVAAGDAPAATSEVVRIFTGAPMPAGLDTVVMQEDTQHDGDRIVLPASRIGENVRRAGEDIAVGECVLAAGTRIRPWHIGVLAALGVARVGVARAPRVALLATGDELVEVATQPKPGQLVNSSAYALAALVAECGGVPISLGIVRDDLAATREALSTTADVIITTGGVSVGDRDFVREALDELELYKVAMKPGKPFAFGRRGETPVFGLPGNPVSTLVAFELFVRPALLAMQGAAITERPRRAVTLPGGYRKPAGRAHYVRARVEGDVAHVHPKQGSAMLSSVLGTNALVEIAAELTEVAPGGTAPAILLELV